jgi:hypothetical protein
MVCWIAKCAILRVFGVFLCAFAQVSWARSLWENSRQLQYAPEGKNSRQGVRTSPGGSLGCAQSLLWNFSDLPSGVFASRIDARPLVDFVRIDTN